MENTIVNFTILLRKSSIFCFTIVAWCFTSSKCMRKLENLSKFRQLTSLGRIPDRMLQKEWIANAVNWSIRNAGVAELRNKQQLSPVCRHCDYISYSLEFHNSEAQVIELRLHMLYFPSFKGFVLVVFLQTTSLF